LRATTFGTQSIAESTIKTYEEFQVNWDYLKVKTAEILGLLRCIAGSRDASRDGRIQEKMVEVGGDLYRELIPTSLRGKLDSAAGGHLLLSIDHDLVHLPWELLHDGQEFMCRKYHMGRIINIPPSPRRAEKKDMDKSIRLLSVVDPEGDLPGALQEGIRIRDMLLEMEGLTAPVLLTRKVKIAHLLDGLRRFDMLHFAGHVGHDEKGSFFRLSDGPCYAKQLEQFAGRYLFPGLVFLNGCRSSQGVPGSFSLDGAQERAFDLASGFLLSGARHFIGTLWDIQDRVATQAGITFFRSLFSGVPVGSALSQAREELIAAFGVDSMFWAGYVLYGDPGFRIRGADRTADRFCRQIDRAGQVGADYKEALAAIDPKERFTAAVALYQMGDGSGVPVIREEIAVLLDLLESPLPLYRGQGAMILKVLCGSDMGYQPEGDPQDRSAAVEAFEQWWAGNPLHSPVDFD
jgi:hypothetical protein